MNSIRRPRGRPRVRSFSFRTLWWLLAYEAAYSVMAHYWCAWRAAPLTRREFAQLWPRSWRSRARKVIRSFGRFTVLS